MKLKKYNIPLIIFPILIFSLGFMSIFSTFPRRATNQLVYFVLGTIFYVVISQIDYRVYKPYWRVPFYLAIALLALTYILGEIRFGATRWLEIGFLAFQPSEFAKIAIILSLSSFLTTEFESLSTVKKITRLLILIIPMTLLVILQPDLGTAIVILSVFLGILFYAGINKVYFALGIVGMGILSSPIWNLLKDYQRQRILVFLNPSLDKLGAGYNIMQAIISIGSGGFFGKGFGKGTQSHLNFLPAYWTDFIFASFAEEWGFFGVFIFITLFCALCFSIISISKNSSDVFGSLLGAGIFFVFFTQFVINVGMNLGMLPITGIPLPLVSYGGSSMVVSMILLGIAQSVWVWRKR